LYQPAHAKATLPFSDAILVGATLYISGRIGIDPATGMAPVSLERNSVALR